MFNQQFSNAEDACALAQAMVDTVREPLVVLDHELRVIAASRSFYVVFSTTPGETLGKPLCDLSDGVWDIPALRTLLGSILSRHIAMDDFEVEHDFPVIGRRSMVLNARKVFYEAGSHTTILLGFEDVTRERDLARQNEDLLHQKDMLLKEFQHRVGNSLAIIASVILMKARMVDSEEARRHLRDAHDRVISFAAIQQSLYASTADGFVELGPHFAKLCAAISNSMIGDKQRITIEARGDGRATCSQAESLGLVITELVINCLTHAFTDHATDGHIVVAYEVSGTDWKLSVSDNGIGKSSGAVRPKSGLGTSIIKALAKQLDAQVATLAGPLGTTVSVTHATFGAGAEAHSPPEVASMADVA
jgi:chemotaxis protein methyltransferase CheR